MTQVNFNLVLPLGVRSEEAISKIDAACREINERLVLEFSHARQEKTGPGVTTEIWEDRHAGTISLVDDTNVPAVYAAPFLRISYGNETTFDGPHSTSRRCPSPSCATWPSVESRPARQH